MKKLGMSKVAFIGFVFCAVSGVSAFAQTFTSLARFDRKDGAYPEGSLVQGFDGELYGTTGDAGARAGGTIFEVTTEGKLTVLHSFCAQEFCADGGYPSTGLTLASDGDFYGTTDFGGGHVRSACEEFVGCGIIFRIDATSNEYGNIYSFCSQANCADGGDPEAALIQATDGNFYGTTYGGGANSEGTVFKFTANGELTTLYSFCSQAPCADGSNPAAALMQATDGNFYGTTQLGGTNGFGTVYKITPEGTLTTLHSFCLRSQCSDGSDPESALIQAADGNFYGVTSAGGGPVNSDCGEGCGTIFKMTPAGDVTTLYRFCPQTSCVDGFRPSGPLVQATDGNFYGVTMLGGDNINSNCYSAGCGTIFQITPAGVFTSLHSFCAQINANNTCTDGAEPRAALVQSTDGNLYGTTAEGGSGGYFDGVGTVFSLSMGLSPFIETVSSSGEVGGDVTILGNNLADTASVSFNGTAAVFTVVSSTEITATVPTGATTGFVTVTTPTATLTSNKKFRVEP